MSRENPYVAKTVAGRLTGTRNYAPQLTLRIMELWGTNTVPDDHVVLEEALSAMSSISVEDGDYALDYSFNGQLVEKAVRVVGGRLTSRAA